METSSSWLGSRYFDTPGNSTPAPSAATAQPFKKKGPRQEEPFKYLDLDGSITDKGLSTIVELSPLSRKLLFEVVCIPLYGRDTCSVCGYCTAFQEEGSPSGGAVQVP
jgi:hypothetical protein